MRNVWAIARPTIVFLFQVVLPAALRVVIPIIEKTTAITKIMSQSVGDGGLDHRQGDLGSARRVLTTG